MALFALLLVLAFLDGRGDATIATGGDSGGELRPALQVLLVCSDLSPARKEWNKWVIGFSFSPFGFRLSPRPPFANSICCELINRPVYSSSHYTPLSSFATATSFLPIWGLISISLGDPADEDPRWFSFTSLGLCCCCCPSLPSVLCWVSLSCLRNFARRFWNQT